MKLFKRKPDFIIGSHDDPYLLRWWVIPRNRFFNIYLHKFMKDDDDRALHDHPWASCSIVLSGGYIEHLICGSYKFRRPGQIFFRRAIDTHRVELYREKCPTCGGEHSEKRRSAWTLFITGPVVRQWGFHCPKGWIHWKDFVDDRDAGLAGKGCGD